ncbi:hypothetical protein V5O48_001797 [Marasmius crinis-equi]|uniref:Peptidase A1 domain-containing protein n=1 Tax=Marasmius crinis-equi TaxID=585013 RepID=A0ABR3FXI0_9AGAR
MPFTAYYALLFMILLHLTAANSLTLLDENGSDKGIRLPVVRIPRPQENLVRRASSMHLSNQNEFSYLVPVQIGGQSFPLILDTGSSDLWVVSNDCTTADCSSVSRYSRSLSNGLQTLNAPFDVGYLKGSVSGVVALDVVRLGSYEIRPQVFGLANDIKDMNLANNGHSGILGLCLPATRSIAPEFGPTVLENIFQHIDNPYFALKLGSHPGPDDPSSSLTIGQLDGKYASSLSDLHFIPVSSAGASNYNFWKVPMQGIVTHGMSIPLSPSSVRGVRKGQIAVLDSGTTLMLGPTMDVDAIWKSLGPAARYNRDVGCWEVRCNKAVDVRIILGPKNNEKEYPVEYDDMNWEDSGDSEGWCMGGIQANDDVDSGDWLLGDTFLRSVYAVHFVGNSTHTPHMGLLGTVNREAGIQQFRAKRGPDQDQSSQPEPPMTTPRGLDRRVMPAASTLYALGSVGGFISGAAAMTAFRLWRRFFDAGRRW